MLETATWRFMQESNLKLQNDDCDMVHCIRSIILKDYVIRKSATVPALILELTVSTYDGPNKTITTLSALLKMVFSQEDRVYP